MQPWSMTLDKILTHAAAQHGHRAVVSQSPEGGLQVGTYRQLCAHAQTISAALVNYGIKAGDRVGSLMWNDFDHLATWFGVMGIGAVLHTLNPRLGAARVGWIAAHGGDRMIVCSEDTQGILRDTASTLGCVERIIVSGAAEVEPNIGGIAAQSLDAFLAGGEPLPAPAWGDFDEDCAAGLCYTSGTTGPPKGVLYSHRSNMLHALTVNQPGGFGIGPGDVVLAIVPMFHANAWALPFIAPIVGAELVLPGRNLDGASLARMINTRGVTFAAGVPTIWQALLHHLDETGTDVPSLRRVVIGGSAPSRDLVERLSALGVDVLHGWGMTELSPLGAISSGSIVRQEARFDRILRQGHPPFPTQAEIFDEHGIPCSHDDREAGALRVRGPSVAQAYFGSDSVAVDEDGWFETGDIAVIDESGSIRLIDRAKDVIKSGGEWISSIELENAAMTHPAVRRAAVIGVPDVKWGERPLLVIEADDVRPGLDELVDHMRPSVPAWWLPNQIAYCVIPLGATGKIDKVLLRQVLLNESRSVAASAESGG